MPRPDTTPSSRTRACLPGIVLESSAISVSARRSMRLSELAWLPFVSTVQDYADRFNPVLCHAWDLSVSQKVKLFIGGILDHIREDAELRAPQDLQTVCTLHGRSSAARRLYHSHRNLGQGYRSSTRKQRSRFGNAGSFSSPPYKNLSQGSYPVPRSHQPRIFVTMAYTSSFAPSPRDHLSTPAFLPCLGCP